VASLREIKDRIGSVRSTLKITSAMKLVASAKLRKAQRAIEGMRPYERTLAEILAALPAGAAGQSAAASNGSAANYFSCSSSKNQFAASHATLPQAAAASAPPSTTPTHAAAAPSIAGLDNRHSPTPIGESRTAVVAIASNSSLCGGFNANVIRKALETIRGCEGTVEVYPLGRKMVEALRRAGYTADADYNDLVGHPSYEKSAALARSLAERFERGELSRVVLVYNRFASASRQEPVAEEYLPFSSESPERAAGNYFSDKFAEKPIAAPPSTTPARDFSSFAGLTGESPDSDYILEPDAAALAAQLLPQVMILKFHAAILDSAAAEQAARTIAMQTASDNAEDLLGELTLEYNKGRQQKITAEILDLLGGAQ
jgi:F-type H+-transporting ATPase subunit gamma